MLLLHQGCQHIENGMTADEEEAEGGGGTDKNMPLFILLLNTDSQTSIKSAKSHCYSPKPEIFRLQSYLKKCLHHADDKLRLLLLRFPWT